MNPSMRTAFRRLGWGLVFPLIDLRFGFFDIFPDIIGYIMILIALGQLAGNNGFKQAKWLAAILMFLSLPQLMIKASTDINQLSAAPLGTHVYGQGTAMLHTLLAYLIFRGLYTAASPIASPELLNAIVNRRKFYMALFVSQFIFYPFLLNMEDSWAIMLLFFGIFIIVAELLLIRIPFRISHIKNTHIDYCDNKGSEKEADYLL